MRPLLVISLLCATVPGLECQTQETGEAFDAGALYRQLHRSPELSFEETETAARMAREMRAAGLEVTERVGGHGVVGILRNGSGRTLLLRADMDALPLEEKTGADYASAVAGRMHACGHDVHMTVLIASLRELGARRDDWKGTIVAVAQPAEERGGGAKAMLADGLYSRFPRPVAALALHVNAGLPAGKVGFCEGFALAAVDMIDLTIFGRGGHGAYPHRTKDPIVIAAELIVSLQSIVAREVRPGDPAVVTVGSIHGGTKHNIIPDEVRLELTTRCYREETRAQILEAIERRARAAALAAGIGEDRMPRMSIRDESLPSVYNDPAWTKRAAAAAAQALGEDRVTTMEPVMGAEDFGLYGRTETPLPICIFWLGAVPPAEFEESLKSGRTLPSLHSSEFLPDADRAIPTGVKAMSAAAIEMLKG